MLLLTSASNRPSTKTGGRSDDGFEADCTADALPCTRTEAIDDAVGPGPLPCAPTLCCTDGEMAPFVEKPRRVPPCANRIAFSHPCIYRTARKRMTPKSRDCGSSLRSRTYTGASVVSSSPLPAGAIKRTRRQAGPSALAVKNVLKVPVGPLGDTARCPPPKVPLPPVQEVESAGMLPMF